MLRRVAQAIGRLPVRGILTTGRAVDPNQIPAPENVEVLQVAPHRRLLADVAVVVTHAGHGTVLKTLAAGVPMVCMPMGRDQKDNTVRVLRLGAGIRISESSTPDQIAAAISNILNDARYTPPGKEKGAGIRRRRSTQPRRRLPPSTRSPRPTRASTTTS